MPAMLMEPAGGETFAPHQLWERLLIERGFLSSPSGTKDSYRIRPANLPDDLSGPGAPLGKGYETLAIIQVTDKAGERIGPLGLGMFAGGGADRHAEAEILRKLPASPRMRGGRMIVVVDTPVCPSCTSKLVVWGKEAGLAAIDTYVPERPSMVGGVMASAKTTARTAVMVGRPRLHLRFQGISV